MSNMRAFLAYRYNWTAFGLVAAVMCLSVPSCYRATAQPESAQPQQMDIRSFVHETYIEGMPYDAANAYGSDAVTTLLEMLNDPDEAPYRANIAVALCIIGDERAVEPVISLIEEPVAGELSAQDYRAKAGTVMALGYLVNKSANDQALQYLLRSVDPDSWSERGIQWKGPFQPTLLERNVDLSSQAILGLALSGRPEASVALSSIPEAKFLGIPAVSEFVQAAQAAHQQVAQDGLSEYYRKSKSGFGN